MLPASDPEPVELSPAELEALRYIAAGLRVHEIADLLHFAPVTIKDRLTSARRKLRAKNHAHAVALALRAGLIH